MVCGESAIKMKWLPKSHWSCSLCAVIQCALFCFRVNLLADFNSVLYLGNIVIILYYVSLYFAVTKPAVEAWEIRILKPLPHPPDTSKAKDAGLSSHLFFFSCFTKILSNKITQHNSLHNRVSMRRGQQSD